MESKEHWNYRVLIVDDEAGIHTDFQDMLNPSGAQASTDHLAGILLDEDLEDTTAFLPSFELLHATGGEEAYEIIRAAKKSNRPIAVAYIDVRMPPGIDGVETIRRIRQIEKDIELIIMTAYTDKPLPEIVRDMELLHKLLYIRKPFAPEEIQQITRALVEKWNIEQELAKKQQQLITNHQRLEISHQRLETVLDSTADAIGMFDEAGHLLFANQWYQQLFDLTETQLQQMSPDDLKARMKTRFQESKLSQVEGSTQPKNIEDIVEEIGDASQSEPRLFYRSTTPVWNGHGDCVGNVVSFRDMSEEVKVQQMKAEVLRLRAELETTYSFGEIVGKSQKMKDVIALTQRAIESNITVLIRGESGTGKELVAKAIHFNSPRKAGPFVIVNCAAIPETLIESELFGYEQGAFTGASSRRIGKFEQANGGTILLDEIGDMQLELQAKLLRVLQERQIQRVGGTTTIPIDIRVLTATNKDLETLVKMGNFREDLFYRVTAFPIVIPPLRERREDIPLLANHFLEQYAQSTDNAIRAISAGALQLLTQYDFPGNVRELENVIERAVLLETTDLLQPNNLSEQILSILPSQGASTVPADSIEILPLADVERQALVHALETTDNNITKAAQALGINRSTLYRKLKLYELPVSG